MAAYVRCKDDNGKYFCKIEPMDVTLIANEIKKVPAEYINEKGNGITQACVEYLLPLIEGECDIEYKNGLPCHFTF